MTLAGIVFLATLALAVALRIGLRERPDMISALLLKATLLLFLSAMATGGFEPLLLVYGNDPHLPVFRTLSLVQYLLMLLGLLTLFGFVVREITLHERISEEE